MCDCDEWLWLYLLLSFDIQTVFGKLKTTYEKRVWSGSIYSWRVSPKLTTVNSRTKANKKHKVIQIHKFKKQTLYLWIINWFDSVCACIGSTHTSHTHSLTWFAVFFFFNNSTPLVMTSLNVYDVYVCGLMWIRGA